MVYVETCWSDVMLEPWMDAWIERIDVFCYCWGELLRKYLERERVQTDIEIPCYDRRERFELGEDMLDMFGVLDHEKTLCGFGSDAEVCCNYTDRRTVQICRHTQDRLGSLSCVGPETCSVAGIVLV